jgi:SAM-dependent MidA family methyltransferase
MGHLGVPGLTQFAAPSSLLTTWWSQEQLLTPHPAGLYSGQVQQVVTERSVGYALERLIGIIGSFQPTAVHQGLFTWDVEAHADGGPFTLRLPRALDEVGRRGRSRRLLPERMADNAQSLRALGLTRYLAEPREVVLVDGSLPVLISAAAPDHLPLSFKNGRLELGTSDASARASELLTEVVAALAYHYRPDLAGGAAVSDISFNDGDFRARRRADGSFELRLQVVRHIDSGLGPETLLLHLLQLHAYERFEVGGDDLGLPVLISNPSIAFAGLVRGWQNRALDLGFAEGAATSEARAWIQRFSRSPEGRAYRPWAEAFLEGQLPASFGTDLREGHSDLGPMRQRQHVFALAARTLDRPEREQAASEFGAFIASAAARTTADAPPPAVANPEHFGSVRFPVSLEGRACELLPTFEEYMDLCLHDPAWGYYGHRVQIGTRGHFDTHPEALSPDYGAWVAERALAAWRDLLFSGELQSEDRFSLVEFGAGNGRLARDVLDAVASRAEDPSEDVATWRAFHSRLEYRIYELSVALADKQRQLLGTDAVVAHGDARTPEACLERDFPSGLRGLIISNEVPDAFGVHKVLLPRTAEPLAALVLPRLDVTVRRMLPAGLAQHIREAHARVASALELSARADEEFLDRATFRQLMTHLADMEDGPRATALAGLWFEEAYVRAAAIPRLALHLEANRAAYERALSQGKSGLSMYVNVHASDFIRGLGRSLAAGFVLTIDYGGSTGELCSTLREGRLCFRVYGSTTGAQVPRANDPYSFPGTQDLTADVNFSDLARAGEDVGLTVIHYGPETDLVGSTLGDVLAAGSARYGALLDEYGFKVLVQGTRKSDFFAGPGLTPLSLE